MKDVKEKVRAKLLQLSRETLHPLDDGRLTHVGGGACDTTSWTTEIVTPQACNTTTWPTDSPH